MIRKNILSEEFPSGTRQKKRREPRNIYKRLSHHEDNPGPGSGLVSSLDLTCVKDKDLQDCQITPLFGSTIYSGRLTMLSPQVPGLLLETGGPDPSPLSSFRRTSYTWVIVRSVSSPPPRKVRLLRRPHVGNLSTLTSNLGSRRHTVVRPGGPILD